MNTVAWSGACWQGPPRLEEEASGLRVHMEGGKEAGSWGGNGEMEEKEEVRERSDWVKKTWE